MPGSSPKQRKAAGAALAAKRGDMPVSKLKGAALQMFHSMTAKELRDFARKPKSKKKRK